MRYRVKAVNYGGEITFYQPEYKPDVFSRWFKIGSSFCNKEEAIDYTKGLKEREARRNATPAKVYYIEV